MIEKEKKLERRIESLEMSLLNVCMRLDSVLNGADLFNLVIEAQTSARDDINGYNAAWIHGLIDLNMSTLFNRSVRVDGKYITLYGDKFSAMGFINELIVSCLNRIGTTKQHILSRQLNPILVSFGSDGGSPPIQIIPSLCVNTAMPNKYFISCVCDGYSDEEGVEMSNIGDVWLKYIISELYRIMTKDSPTAGNLIMPLKLISKLFDVSTEEAISFADDVVEEGLNRIVDVIKDESMTSPSPDIFRLNDTGKLLAYRGTAICDLTEEKFSLYESIKKYVHPPLLSELSDLEYVIMASKISNSAIKELIEVSPVEPKIADDES